MTLAAFHLSEQLDLLVQQSLKRQPRAVEHGVTPLVMRQGQAFVNFSSNDYLGMAGHPALQEAVMDTLKTHGVGSGAAHLITGHSELHERLEARLAALSGYPRALLFSTGYMANMGVIDALLSGAARTAKGVLYQDKLNHASLIDGARLSGAVHRRYPHRDLDVLERWLSSDEQPQKLIATDQVFSMEGSEIDLVPYVQLAERYQAGLMIDDAHGFGVRSTPLPRVDVYMATLGKAVGTFGAFVAGSEALIEFLQSRARTFCFTTATPPILAAATMASLDLIEQESWRRARLQAHIVRLRAALIEQGWMLTESSSAIQPIIVGEADRALALSRQLEARGILAVAIRPPTVPQGQSRLRITLSAAHTEAQVEQLIDALKEVRG